MTEEQDKEAKVILQRIVSENQDSITVGTPGEGQIKVYGDSANLEDFKLRIKNMKELLSYAKG